MDNKIRIVPPETWWDKYKLLVVIFLLILLLAGIICWSGDHPTGPVKSEKQISN